MLKQRTIFQKQNLSIFFNLQSSRTCCPLASVKLYDLVLKSFIKINKALDWYKAHSTNHSMVCYQCYGFLQSYLKIMLLKKLEKTVIFTFQNINHDIYLLCHPPPFPHFSRGFFGGENASVPLPELDAALLHLEVWNSQRKEKISLTGTSSNGGRAASLCTKELCWI